MASPHQLLVAKGTFVITIATLKLRWVQSLIANQRLWYIIVAIFLVSITMSCATWFHSPIPQQSPQSFACGLCFEFCSPQECNYPPSQILIRLQPTTWWQKGIWPAQRVTAHDITILLCQTARLLTGFLLRAGECSSENIYVWII